MSYLLFAWLELGARICGLEAEAEIFENGEIHLPDAKAQAAEASAMVAAADFAVI